MTNELDKSLQELRLINARELGRLLGRTEVSIRTDAGRRPDTLPPRFRPPGARKLRWRLSEVKAWMDRVSAG